MQRIRATVATLRRQLAELEPGTYSPAEAATLAEELAFTENACGTP